MWFYICIPLRPLYSTSVKSAPEAEKKNTPATPPLPVPSPATRPPGRPAAQQKRSRRTEDKLLSAAAQVLDREGLDGATVPRIAAEAKLSPASIYRRFADKDDLLRATFLRIIESSNTEDAHRLWTPLVGESLSETVAALIGALLRQFREHPQLLRALNRMVEAEPASPFTREITGRLSTNIGQAAEVLLAHREQIRHPDPERAARFAVLSATSAIEMAALDPSSLWHVALPLGEKAFAGELSRQMLAYLRKKP